MNLIEFKKQLEQNMIEYENAREFIWRRKAIMELTNVFATFNINATLFCSSALFFTGIVDDSVLMLNKSMTLKTLKKLLKN